MISVIVPVGSRRSPIDALYREYKVGLQATGQPFEVIFVLDGPRPEASRDLQQLLREGEDLTIVSLTRCFGESAALMAGFERATGDYVVTLPAYHQIDPQDIGRLVQALSAADMAVAHRVPRAGGQFDRARRSTYHSLVTFATGARYRDLGCGARAMRRQVLEELELYGDQHRFIAILATRLGFNVREVDVRQSIKHRRERVYRPREYAHHALDLFSVFFLARFTKRPLRFFGMVGAGTFGVGALLITLLGAQRIFFDQQLADRPALLLAALLLVLGLQIFALGLLGELIIFTHARSVKDYRVETVVHYPVTSVRSGTADDEEPLSKDGDRRANVPPAAAAV
jgi:glycosyltransferase involved in cell wall biosynthesis